MTSLITESTAKLSAVVRRSAGRAAGEPVLVLSGLPEPGPAWSESPLRELALMEPALAGASQAG